MTNVFAKYDSTATSLSCLQGSYGYQIKFIWQLKTTFSVVIDKTVAFISLCGLISPWHHCFFLRKIKFFEGGATKEVSEKIGSDPQTRNKRTQTHEQEPQLIHSIWEKQRRRLQTGLLVYLPCSTIMVWFLFPNILIRKKIIFFSCLGGFHNIRNCTPICG